jgi:hypothetical protein
MKTVLFHDSGVNLLISLKKKSAIKLSTNTLFLGQIHPKAQAMWRVTGCPDKYVTTQCSYSKHTI